MKNKDLSNHFFHDAKDFLHRYDTLKESYTATTVASQRAKLFIDLRFALECILKSLIAYYNSTETPPKNHKINELLGKIDNKQRIPNCSFTFFKDNKRILDEDLNVSLRYRGETWALKNGTSTQNNKQRNGQGNYYATIGSEDWLDDLEKHIRKVCDQHNTTLQSHSAVVSGTDIKDKIFISDENSVLETNS